MTSFTETYLGETQRILGALPTTDTIILERFFDDSGGMQLVLHAPFGSRVNRAWRCLPVTSGINIWLNGKRQRVRISMTRAFTSS